jgi:hypothetical protein
LSNRIFWRFRLRHLHACVKRATARRTQKSYV